MTTLHRAVFLDRDGTIARDVHYCRRVEDFEILPRVAEAIKLLNHEGYRVVIITNQSGVARGYFTDETLSLIHQKMIEVLKDGGAHIDGVYICPHHPDDKCECRKPKPTLIVKAAVDIGIALDQSYMIGDDPKDVEAGKAAGCRTILLTGSAAGQPQDINGICDHVAVDLYEAVGWLLQDAAERSSARIPIMKSRQEP
ncbi:MAG: D-glycero-beta-D-manno-heptose 1,7-bisphosphate 7-phosphatase [Dehalococcoidia bacterium]|nr:D-glycero-beta-D-manno-heptose 1,7-bisphosphate 7-phosphatase [Dehalococcoidia bacterium]